jgi:ADP-ribose pyrophosphatase YjhB (NUDIX family)
MIVTFATQKKKAQDNRRELLQLLDAHRESSLILRGIGDWGWGEHIYLLGRHPTHGEIWGNSHANQQWPKIKESTIYGACVCVFLLYQGKRFCVLVKSERSSQLTLPGGLCQNKEVFVVAAKREVKEETGLEIDKPQFLMDWSFPGPYANMTWKYRKRIFYTDAQKKHNWIPHPSEELTKLDPKLYGCTDPEIESIYLLSTSSLQLHMQTRKKYRINLRHFTALERAYDLLLNT